MSASKLFRSLLNQRVLSQINPIRTFFQNSQPSIAVLSAQYKGRDFSTNSSRDNPRPKFNWRTISLLAVPTSIAVFAAVNMSSTETSSKRMKMSDGSGLPEYRRKTTTFSDPAIGEIELNEACVKIIQTPEFNRLHGIKQTGCLNLVYPSANHSRFAHSLGTCFLAGEVIKRLRMMQPELNINDRDVLSVEIAALCHDLGHGPFSHTFDMFFLPLARPDLFQNKTEEEKWAHENASLEMFDHLLKNNPEVKKFLDKILTEEDYAFIKEAILPKKEKEDKDEWPYKGRGFEKAFLYDIVSNKSHGIDVDKLDYFKRDSFHLAVCTAADMKRIIKHARVHLVGIHQRPTICYPDKVVNELNNLARTRAQLHTVAYQHRTVKCIDAMLVDAMLIADKQIRAPGKNGVVSCLSQSIHDMEAYAKFNDQKVLSDIICSTCEELEPARAIITRIDKRDLYAKVGEVESSDKEINSKLGSGLCTKTSAAIAACLPTFQQEHPKIDGQRLEKSLAVMIADIHGGMKDENPVENVWLFRKGETKAYRMDKKKAETFGPPIREKVVRVFCRENDDDLINCAQKCFNKWCSQNGLDNRSRTSTDSDESGHFSPKTSDGD